MSAIGNDTTIKSAESRIQKITAHARAFVLFLFGAALVCLVGSACSRFMDCFKIPLPPYYQVCVRIISLKKEKKFEFCQKRLLRKSSALPPRKNSGVWVVFYRMRGQGGICPVRERKTRESPTQNSLLFFRFGV
jgi:hypothetical protein